MNFVSRNEDGIVKYMSFDYYLTGKADEVLIAGIDSDSLGNPVLDFKFYSGGQSYSVMFSPYETADVDTDTLLDSWCYEAILSVSVDELCALLGTTVFAGFDPQLLAEQLETLQEIATYVLARRNECPT